jgi:hypothetical protein
MTTTSTGSPEEVLPGMARGSIQMPLVYDSTVCPTPKPSPSMVLACVIWFIRKDLPDRYLPATMTIPAK